MNAVRRSAVPLPLRDFLRSPEISAELKALRTPSPGRFLLAVAFNYAVIAVAIAGVVRLFTLLVSDGIWPGSTALGTTALGALVLLAYFAAILLIAARQHGILILMHDGSHSTISRNRALNDWLSDMLCGAPMLISTRSYRENHLAHHQNLNTAQDPDWSRKIEDDSERARWLFPSQRALGNLLVQLYSHSVTYLVRTLIENQPANENAGSNADLREDGGGANNAPVPTSEPRPSDRQLAYGKYALYLTLLAAGVWLFSPMGFLMGVLLFWLVPMFLVLPLIMRIRSIAEHFALRHDHPLTQTRTVRAGWLERTLLAPHNVGLHIDHHLLASVPFFNLPKLHQLLLGCDYYKDNAHLNDGYFFGGTGTRFVDDMYSHDSVLIPV